VKLHEKFIL